MKVLHINRNYLTTELHQEMLEYLITLKIENIVFAPTEDRFSAVIEPNDYVIVSECFTKYDRFLFNLKQFKIQTALENKCDVKIFDCIHAYTLFTDGNCAMNISRKYGIPYIVTVRNTDVNDFFKRLPYLRKCGMQIMEKASAICFLSETYRRQVFDAYVPNTYKDKLYSKTYIIPNGVDNFWLNNTVSDSGLKRIKKINNKELRIVYAGRIDKNKNIMSTVKAIELLNKDGWNAVLTVVGNVEDKKEFRNIIASAFVTYLPSQPKNKLINIYRNNDIFVMPSLTESFGLVYVEAMSQGLPIVYSAGQGFDGQFEEGTIGYHVNSLDVEDIAMAVKKIACNYKEISNNCSSATYRFNWEVITKEYECIYKAII